jgi:hypothetical protein
VRVQKLASAAKICFVDQSLRSRHISVGTGHECQLRVAARLVSLGGKFLLIGVAEVG